MILPIVSGEHAILLNNKICGLTINKFLAKNETSIWYEAIEDAGERKILYLYNDECERNKDIPRVHKFRTTCDVHCECDPSVYCIVGDYRLMMDQELKSSLISPLTIPKEISEWRVESVLGPGYKGVTYIAVRQKGPSTTYALKLTIAEEYDGKTFLPEVDMMVGLAMRDRQHFPQIHDCGEYVYQGNKKEYRLIYFVEDLMPGMTLEKYIQDKGDTLNVRFLETFTREMLTSISNMQSLKLMHDDLHAGNIIISDFGTGAFPCIIDFGSTKTLDHTKKDRDDIRNLATHIANIINTIDGYGNAKAQHECQVLTACKALHAVMCDEDPMRQPDSAARLLIDYDKYFPRGKVKQNLEQPFDFGNAEEVLDNELLHKLAAKSFPWRDKIESSSNMLLVGPRGCGKTTVFRSMSFNCLADAGKIGEALSKNYIGIYISCNNEFRLKFSSVDSELIKKHADAIRHYFNLLVIREYTQILIFCCKEQQIREYDLRLYISFISTNIHIDSKNISLSMNGLYELKGEIVRQIDKTRVDIWNDRPCVNLTTQAFVSDLAKMSVERLGIFQGKCIFLFVDDYTERKVPREAQKILNHILFVPNGFYKAKISSEVFGVPYDQTLGSFIDQDRDYKEWNLGTLYYLCLPNAEQKAFLSEIVDNRLTLCGYRGKIKDIIGDSQYPEGTLARALKAEENEKSLLSKELPSDLEEKVLDELINSDLQKTKKKVYYHGWDTICELCTGDISNILEVLDRIYGSCRVSKTTSGLIEERHQHSVIQSYSMQYIAKIKGIPRYGDKLFQIVNSFGNLSAQLLKKHAMIDRGSGRADPYQLIRIEIDDNIVQSANNLLKESTDYSEKIDKQKEAELLWLLLQRHCIFIDAEESRSRRNTLASKVILRRIFCPAFGTTLVNSESLTISKANWIRLCYDPEGFTEQYLRKALRKPDQSTPLLFD